MSARPELIERLMTLVRPLVERGGFELIDVECRGSPGNIIVRLYVDRVGGINVDECAAISRDISLRLDIEDLIDGRYRLEVSSPGLARPLTTPADFRRAVGRQVRISTRGTGQRQKGRREVIGELLSVGEGAIRLRLVSGDVTEIGFEQVDRASPVVDFGSRRES
jgi:ribosome maturation factor RimP